MASLVEMEHIKLEKRKKQKTKQDDGIVEESGEE